MIDTGLVRLPKVKLYLVAALCFASGCGHDRAKESVAPAEGESSTVLPLNELSPEQLRTVIKGYPGDWRNDADQSKGLPSPPATKPVPADAERIDLTPVGGLDFDEMSLHDAIATRRSVRAFSPTPLSIKQLSFLLWASQGVTDTQHDESGKPIQFRAAPSGGGRYPLETYLVVNRIAGLDAGLYRYLPGDHQLISIRKSEEISNELKTACYGQQFVADASVTFIWAAIPERTEWKYAYLSARLIAMEAGHVCQNLYLSSGAAGAGCCALLGYDQGSIDRLLGVDGRDEFAIYLAAVGVPAKSAP